MGPVDREISWEIEIINDHLALEFVEVLSLNFKVHPDIQVRVNLALAAGEFIRDRVIVKIADDDGKSYFAFATKSDMTITYPVYEGVLETGMHTSQSWWVQTFKMTIEKIIIIHLVNM